MQPEKPDEAEIEKAQAQRGGSLCHAGAEADLVDEEVDESFPASDPPSWSGSTADRSRPHGDDQP